MRAYYTLAELRLQLLYRLERNNHSGTTVRVRFRSVGTDSEDYPRVVATPQRLVFVFGDATYKPGGKSWSFRSDERGYATVDLAHFEPDGNPSFYVLQGTGGQLLPVGLVISRDDELHFIAPGLPRHAVDAR